MDFINIFFVPEMAFLGGSIGAGEWLMLFVVVLVVVGPKRLPEVARKFGKTMEMFRRAADEFKEQLLSMDKEVKDTVGDATGDVDLSVEGDEGSDDSYGENYEYDEGAYDDSDYPGNEDMVSEWESESGADSEDTSDNLETPDQVAASDESPDDDAGSDSEEASDDPARGEAGSTEEKS